MTLFSSLLGPEFGTLDPFLKWVHRGESCLLRGTVTVRRETGLFARTVGALAFLPPAMIEAPIAVRIEVTNQGETWTRWFAHSHRMTTMLRRDGEFLVERLGPCALRFRLLARDRALEWVLAHVSVFGVALPARWFCIGAKIDAQHGHYRVSVDAGTRRWGSVVHYECSLDAAG